MSLKLLLTSGGIQNNSIKKSLIELIGKPIHTANALCITTASYALENGPILAYRFLTGIYNETPMCELGWKSIGVLELSTIPNSNKEFLPSILKGIDVLLVNGGDPMYLNYWMKQSGLASLLPSLDITYVGLSAGSMILAPNIGNDFVNWKDPENTDITLGLVDFAIYPHLNHPKLPNNTLENAQKWSEKMQCTCYVIDDQTAIKVLQNKITVVSEGNWTTIEKTVL
jgi:dipeptidase E